MGIPALVGVADIFDVVQDGMPITIDCSQGATGFIYEGILAYHTQEISYDADLLIKFLQRY